MTHDTTLAEARRRVKARRHAKQMAAEDFGPSGYMALLCGGGDACPYTFEPWEPNFLKAEGGGNDRGRENRTALGERIPGPFEGD